MALDAVSCHDFALDATEHRLAQIRQPVTGRLILQKPAVRHPQIGCIDTARSGANAVVMMASCIRRARLWPQPIRLSLAAHRRAGRDRPGSYVHGHTITVHDGRWRAMLRSSGLDATGLLGPTISRGQLFALGEDATSGGEGVLRLLWNTLAWGRAPNPARPQSYPCCRR